MPSTRIVCLRMTSLFEVALLLVSVSCGLLSPRRATCLRHVLHNGFKSAPVRSATPSLSAAAARIGAVVCSLPARGRAATPGCVAIRSGAGAAVGAIGVAGVVITPGISASDLSDSGQCEIEDRRLRQAQLLSSALPRARLLSGIRGRDESEASVHAFPYRDCHGHDSTTGLTSTTTGRAKTGNSPPAVRWASVQARAPPYGYALAANGVRNIVLSIRVADVA
jgi:hypothetical protein